MTQPGHTVRAGVLLGTLALLCGEFSTTSQTTSQTTAQTTAQATAQTPAQTSIQTTIQTTGPADASQTARTAQLRQSDLRIRFWQSEVARDPVNNLSYDRLAAAFTQKARETGDISYFQLAEGALRESLKLESEHADAAPAYTQLAAVQLAEHRFREAGEDAERAIALMPNDLAAFPCAGDAQLELGNYDLAQRFYDRIRTPTDDREPAGLDHPGIAFLATSHGAGLDWMHGDVATANDDLERAIAFGRAMHLPAENIAWTEFMLGEQFFQAGDLAAAERAEAASLHDFPRYHRALAAMGQIRAAQQRYPEAIAFYKDAIAIIPLPLYLAALGDIYTASGDTTDANKQYQTVEFIGRLNEINQQVYNRELALFYADHNRNLPGALTLAQKELEVRHDIYTSDALAWVLLKNNRPAQAKIEMDRALRLGTVDAMLEFHAGMIDANLGDAASAKRHLERALAINPHFHVLFAQQAVKTLATLSTQSVTTASSAIAGAADAH
jgi:tetratricopeptide (TPR) repeat protein